MGRPGQLGGHAAKTKLCHNICKISDIHQQFKPLQMQTCESFSVKMMLAQGAACWGVEIWHVLTVGTMLVRSRTLIWKVVAKESALSTSFNTTILRDVHQSVFSTIGHLVLDKRIMKRSWRGGIGTKMNKGSHSFYVLSFGVCTPWFYYFDRLNLHYTYVLRNIIAIDGSANIVVFNAASPARSAGRLVSGAARGSASESWSTLLVLGRQSFTMLDVGRSKTQYKGI